MAQNYLKFWLLGCCLFVVIGCSIVKARTDDYFACKNDPICIAQVQAKKAQVENAVSSVLPLTGASGASAGVVVKVLGALSAVVTAVVLGKKIKDR